MNTSKIDNDILIKILNNLDAEFIFILNDRNKINLIVDEDSLKENLLFLYTINSYLFDEINSDETLDDYIINTTKRHHNNPDFDNFLNILNNCDFYIGSDSGSTEFALAYSNTRVLYTRKNDYQGILIKKRKIQADNKYNITLLKNFYDIST